MSTLQPENLLQTLSESEWEIKNFSADEADWKKSAEGSIIQTTISSESDLAKGSALLLKPTATSKHDVLYMEMVPGTEYYSGCVFNYIDESNFALFKLNNFSKYTNKGSALIIHVQDGVPSILSEKKYEKDFTENQRLVIYGGPEGLTMLLNEEEIFLWDDISFVHLSMIGLYSQKNNDAKFIQLSAGTVEELEEVVEMDEDVPPIEEEEEVPTEDPLTKEVEYKDGFQNFLTIQEPYSASQVEFKEVFTVPLDRFYVSLFKNSSIVRPVEILVDELDYEVGQVIKRKDLDFEDKVLSVEKRNNHYYFTALIKLDTYDEFSPIQGTRTMVLDDQFKEVIDHSEPFQENHFKLYLPLLERKEGLVWEKYNELEFIQIGSPNPVEQIMLAGTDAHPQLFLSPERDFFIYHDHSNQKLFEIDQSGIVIKEYEVDLGGFRGVSVSPNGKYIINIREISPKNSPTELNFTIIDRAEEAILFEFNQSGFDRTHFEDYDFDVNSIRFSPEGEAFLIQNDTSVYIVSIRNQGVLRTISIPHESQYKSSVCFINSNQVAEIEGSNIQVWHIDGGDPKTLQHDQSIHYLYAYDEHKVIFGTGIDDTVYLWDINTDNAQPIINDFGRISNFSKKSDSSAFLTQIGNEIRVYQTSDFSNPLSIDAGTHIAFQFSPGGNHLIGEDDEEGLKVYDLQADKYVEPNVGSTDARIVAHTKNCEQFILTSEKDGKLYVWDMSSSTILHESSHLTGFQELAFTQDEQSIVYIKTHNSYSLVDSKGVLKYAIENRYSSIEDPLIKVSEDGQKVLLSYAQGEYRIWDLVTQEFQCSLHIQLANPDHLLWFGDSKWIIAEESFQKLKLFAVHYPKARELRQFDGEKILKIFVAADMPVLGTATEGETNRATFWNMQTGNRIAQYDDYQSDAINGNGEQFLTVDGKTIEIRRVDNAELISTFEIDAHSIKTWFNPNSNRATVLTKNSLQEVVIYQEEGLETSSEKPYSLIQKLDYRPKFWYRGIMEAWERENFFNNLQTKYTGINNQLSNNLQFVLPEGTGITEELMGTQHALVRDQLMMMNEYKLKSDEADLKIYEARDSAQNIIHTLRTSGYKVFFAAYDAETNTYGNSIDIEGDGIEEGIDGEIIEKGYHFAIVGDKPAYKEYPPFKIPSFMDYHTHDSWFSFLLKFRTHLFGSGAVNTEKQLLFDSKSKQLVDFDSSTELKNQKKQIESDIKEVEKKITALETQKIQIETENQAWKADRDKMQQLATAFPYSGDAVHDFRWLYTELPKKQFSRLSLLYSSHSGKSVHSKTFRLKLGWWTVKSYTVHYVTTHNRMKITQRHESKLPKQLELLYDYQEWRKSSVNVRVWGSSSVFSFLQGLLAICQSFVDDTERMRDEIAEDIKKSTNELTFQNKALIDLDDNGLAILRERFIQFWNDPVAFGAQKILANAILPDSDPIADLMDRLRRESTPAPGQDGEPDEIEIDYFEFSGNRYYNKDGLSMPAYLEYIKGSDKKRVAIFPVFTEFGTVDPHSFQSVIDPQPAINFEPQLPVIKFVETYQVRINWKGFHLGELSHTENLFPNESKEITIERKTQLVRKSEESMSSSEVTKMKNTSSFEENLQKEFTRKDTSSSEASLETEDIRKTDSERENEVISQKKEDFSLDVEVGGKLGPFKGSADTKFSKSSDVKSTDKRKDTFETSNTNKAKTANKESHEAFAKDVSNTIKKVSSETTQENKVDIKVSSSEEFTESESQKEIVRIENPNIGRTINFNFFQVQNAFEINTVLTDVKIVVDPNQEVIKGSSTSDVRVYDLEELGKMVGDGDENEPQHILACAITVRQAFKNYLSSVPGIGRGNGALGIKEPFVADRSFLEILNFSKVIEDKSGFETEMLQEISNALGYLKKVPFYFKEVALNNPTTYGVNAGSYYLDSQVGKLPSTEKYLEDRRDIETAHKTAEVEHLKTQTEEKIFFAPAKNNDKE